MGDISKPIQQICCNIDLFLIGQLTESVKIMICFNTNVSPDNNATTALPDGGYNFACVTLEENAEILSLLKSAAEYPADQCGIALAFFSEVTNHKPRYIINQIIIEYAKLSGTPLDVAAEFIALSRKSSTFRPKALEFLKVFQRSCVSRQLPMQTAELCILGVCCTFLQLRCMKRNISTTRLLKLSKNVDG